MAAGGEEQVAVDPGEQSSNFLKIGQFLIDTGGNILRHIIQKLVIDNSQSITFRDFLNETRIRCELFHLGKGELCCVCRNTIFRAILKKMKWDKLYQMFLTQEQRRCPTDIYSPIHNKNHCCVYEAKPNLPDELDISLMCFLILNLSDFNSDDHLKHLILRIRKHRNNYSHKYSTHMTAELFEDLFTDIGKVLRELARFTRNEHLISEIRSQIENRGRRLPNPQENVNTLTRYSASDQKIETLFNVLGNGSYDDLQRLLDLPSNNENERQLAESIMGNIKQFLEMRDDLETDITAAIS